MTRNDEIKEMAKSYARCMTSDEDMQVAFGDALIRGAKWADAHPDIDVRTMAAWQSGYNEAIDKACEWLEENMNDVGIRFMRGDEIKDIVDLFRKAMKGD